MRSCDNFADARSGSVRCEDFPGSRSVHQPFTYESRTSSPHATVVVTMMMMLVQLASFLAAVFGGKSKDKLSVWMRQEA